MRPALQWVHGEITVVREERGSASKLPRKLQWVHGEITVVRSAAPAVKTAVPGFNGSTVRSPWFGATPRIGRRPIDLLRLNHATGEIFSFNLLSVGFTADVAALTNRAFKPFGPFGYLLGVFVRVVQLRRRSFSLRCDEDQQWDERRSLFLTFNNSKYTGGTMLIAPQADPADGLIEFVRWGPIGRLGLIRNLPGLYDGTHIEHPLAEHKAVPRVEFALEQPVDVMVDGEVITLHCEELDVLSGALNVVV